MVLFCVFHPMLSWFHDCFPVNDQL